MRNYQCDNCKKQLCRYQPLDDIPKPHAGGFVICGGCGQIYQFGESLELVTMDADTLGEFAAAHPQLYDKLFEMSLLIKAKLN